MAGFAVCWMTCTVTLRRRWNSQLWSPSQISRCHHGFSQRQRPAFSSSGM